MMLLIYQKLCCTSAKVNLKLVCQCVFHPDGVVSPHAAFLHVKPHLHPVFAHFIVCCTTVEHSLWYILWLIKHAFTSH